MSEIERLSAKIEEVEARCIYLAIICSAMLRAMPDKAGLLKLLEIEEQMNDANSLYATSLSDSQQQRIRDAMGDFVTSLRSTPG